MRYRTQAVAYPYFVVAMLFYGLQMAFGLLSTDKCVLYVIVALPAILEQHPSTVFVVLGATHPHV